VGERRWRTLSDPAEAGGSIDIRVNASQIRIGAREAVVRLTGLVPSEAERDMAERDAWYVFGVDEVENLIEVRPVPETSG